MLSRVSKLVCRYYPLNKGRGRLVQTQAFRHWAKSQGSPVLAILRSGEKIFVDPTDYIGAMIFLFGEFDPAVSSVIRRLLRPGDQFIDVGANVGSETIPAASCCGVRGKVYAFEANPDAASMLKNSLEYNGLEWVTLSTNAVSDQTGTLKLTIPAGNAGIASVAVESEETVESHHVRKVNVKAVMLDEILDLRASKIRLLKIDVEGHELNVLRGAQELLKSGKVENILIEIWHGGADGFFRIPSVRMLTDLGFEPFQLLNRCSMIPYLRKLGVEHPLIASNDFLFRLRR